MTTQQIGSHLRIVRNNAGLSVQELADLSGISIQGIYNVESGGNARLHTINAMAEALRCRVNIQLLRLADEG